MSTESKTRIEDKNQNRELRSRTDEERDAVNQSQEYKVKNQNQESKTGVQAED